MVMKYDSIPFDDFHRLSVSAHVIKSEERQMSLKKCFDPQTLVKFMITSECGRENSSHPVAVAVVVSFV